MSTKVRPGSVQSSDESVVLGVQFDALAKHPDGTPVCDPDESERAAARGLAREARRLLEQLSDARARAVLARCGFEASFETNAEKALKKVTHVLSAYPRSLEWSAVLKESGMKWTKPPLRSTPGALDARLRCWTESDSSAANSSLFSSTGIWTSPKSKWLFAFSGACVLALSCYLFMSMLYDERRPSLELANRILVILFDAITAMLYFAISWALHLGNRWCGRRLVLMSAALCFLFGSWQIPVAIHTGMAGNESLLAEGYSERFSENARHDSIQYGLLCGIVAPNALVLLVLYPARSYYTLSASLLFATAEYTIYSAIRYSASRRARFLLCLSLFVCMLLISSVTYRRRQFALRESKTIKKRDSLRYTMEWMRLRQDEVFVAGLGEIKIGWECAQGKAGDMAKRQQKGVRFLGYGGVEALFHQADALNPLLQAKAAGWIKASGGEHHAAGVKGEERALQKVFRAYREQWTCLCDLVRTSLVFDSPQDLARCLHIIADDPEVGLLRISYDKCRLRVDFDAEKHTGGYRDVQLSLCLANHEEAKRLGCAAHIVEVQLHLKRMYCIKSDDGHTAYVRARNLASD